MKTLARFLVSILVGGATLLGIEPAAASAPISSPDASCRTHLYAGTSKLARGTITRLSKCHARRLRGQIPPSTDCNDPANAVGPLHLERYADSIRDRAAARCEGVASPFSTLGYSACPQPCDGIAVNSYSDFAECLICFTRATMSDLSANVLGTPSAPADADVRRCQERIGKAVTTYMAKRLTVQRRCQLDQDNGDIGSMIDCENGDPDNRMAAALSNLQDALARCGNAPLGSLDSCGATVAAEQACVPPASDTAAGDLFDLVYYPGEIIYTPTPTITPTITHTPTITLTPTITPSPSPTHTFDPNAVDVEMDFKPGGGIAGTCTGTCAGGVADGDPCTSNSQCRVCVGGTNMGMACVSNAQCPSSTCQAMGASTCDESCAGGPYDGLSCTTDGDCSGCNPNEICTGPSAPLGCCTGSDTGNCPAAGSCNILQNPLFAVRVGINGVCAPRSAPDVACITDADCPPLKTCDYGSMTLSLAAQDPNGLAPILVPQATFEVAPAVISGIGTVCLLATGDGHGFVDCDGGAPGIDWLTSQDHNTTPGDPNNSGPGSGLPDDPSCSSSSALPGGLVSYACEEGTEQCVSGINAGVVCTLDSECPGSTCEPCASFAAHAGVCNSPINVVESGTFGAGDMAISIPIAIQVLETGDFGPDALACTGDDLPSSPPQSALFRLSTGLSDAEIVDAANMSGNLVAAGSTCGASPCVTQVDGNPIPCGDLQAGDLDGLVLGACITQLDTAAGDIVTSIRLEALP